jgi:hypothetical protein
VLGEELSGFLLARLEEHGQVAAVDHGAPERARLAHQEAEVLAQLRGAAGQIERPDFGIGGEQLDHARGGAFVHALGALRTRLDVAVVAREVAALADVHLERLDPGTAQLGQAVLGERGRKVREAHRPGGYPVPFAGC